MAARSGDTYLRQAACRLLARRASLDELRALAHAPDEPGRLAAVLSAGTRLTVPAAIGPLPADLAIDYSAGNALFEIQYADARVDLRSRGRAGSFTASRLWKLRKGGREEETLFDLLLDALADPAERVSLQAANFLSLLDDPRSELRIVRAREESAERRLLEAPRHAVGEAWVAGPFPDPPGAAGGSRPPERGTVDLSEEYAVPEGRVSWRRAVAERGRFRLPAAVQGAPATHYLYLRLQSARVERAILEVEGGRPARVLLTGRPAGGATGKLVTLEPGGNALLLCVQTTTEATLGVACRASPDVIPELPERLGPAMLADRLREAAAGGGEVALSREFEETDWPAAARQGDPARGKKLFGADALGCIRCHAVAAGQAGGGALSLTGAGARFTVPQLVESILLPGRQAPPLYRSTLLILAGGLVTGLLVGDTDTDVDLLLLDGTRRRVARAEVRERKLLDLSPMPAGLVKTPDELKDLLAYLLQGEGELGSPPGPAHRLRAWYRLCCFPSSMSLPIVRFLFENRSSGHRAKIAKVRPVFSEARHVIFYDARCELCRRSRRLVERWAGRAPMWFVDANDMQAMSRWPQVDSRAALEDLHVLESGGQVVGGYDAVLKLFGLMPATRWLLPLLKLTPLRPAGRKLYHWVSTNRYWLSRRLFRK